ncbi:BofC C-terminal domain-containing protein [Paenibacillus thermotolerans]|uniref:BofC C-terminal domain-containing protein n=1 Tax=Paenibacillus thermotolerans TaxID=3027807 RepID=UPI002367E6E0|nr:MULTISPECIES: BofC C-terminal domain-containing protein [unclassified Paenibacillus]
MGFFGAFKRQLKKRMRLKRRWLSLGAWLVVVCSLAWYAAAESQSTDTAVRTFQELEPQPARTVPVHKNTEVLLHKIYVCGEELTSLGVHTPAEIQRMMDEHPQWQMTGAAGGKITFETVVDDLSDQCKLNSYIGIDTLGNLTLFDGPPQEQRAVKTFFQLNVEHLESSLPQEAVEDLRRGIRIRDLAEYNSVLSTFSDFAVDETEKVMKPQ